LLFGLIRLLRIRRILEFGGLSGYSATNFLAAVGARGVLYTVDLAPVPKRGVNHHPIQRDAALIAAADVGSEPLDLVFFDCHVYAAQIAAFHTLTRQGIITERSWRCMTPACIRSRSSTGLIPSPMAGCISRWSAAWSKTSSASVTMR
jgi:hypothetical protein